MTIMKRAAVIILCLFFFFVLSSRAQNARVASIFPPGTITHENINYAGDTLHQHNMDIYLPKNAKGELPLIVFIHGGAWRVNDKYSDMNYMKNTVRGFLDSGYAMASIDYRYSTVAKFPAQIQDCNQAIEYLYQHAKEYPFNRDRIALIGFSAGGHLASLAGLSNNDHVKEFQKSETHFKVKLVLDFYGPADLLMLGGSTDTSVNNEQSSIATLLGAMQIKRPDLARKASPVTYIDKNDPPFLIVQGEKDESVPNTQSIMLNSWLTLTGVPSQLIIVPNAPHYGEMFDTPDIRKAVFQHLRRYL
jgi:acetyl esterase/lipase